MRPRGYNWPGKDLACWKALENMKECIGFEFSTEMFIRFADSSVGKNSTCTAIHTTPLCGLQYKISLTSLLP